MRCFVHFDLQMCFAPQRRAIFRDRNFQKWSEHAVFWCVLYILTCRCASRHRGVEFIQIVTSKLAPTLRCFVPFDLQMRFAPQRRAIFSDRHFKNGWGVLCILTWKCASCHSGVPCIISLRNSYTSTPAALASLLFEHQEPRISENTQRPGTTNQWKHTAIRDFPNIWRVWRFPYWSFVFWLDFSTLLFNCPYCRKLDF